MFYILVVFWKKIMYTENVDGKFEFVHTSLGPPRNVVNVQGNAKEFLTLLFFLLHNENIWSDLMNDEKILASYHRVFLIVMHLLL